MLKLPFSLQAFSWIVPILVPSKGNENEVPFDHENLLYTLCLLVGCRVIKLLLASSQFFSRRAGEPRQVERHCRRGASMDAEDGRYEEISPWCDAARLGTGKGKSKT